MKMLPSYLLSIVAALIPLLIALAVTWGLYEFAGVGVPRNFYDLIRSNAGVVEESNTGVGSKVASLEEYSPRWKGTEEDPINLLFLGTSPSMHAVIPEEANKLEQDLHVNVYNAARTNFQFYRFVDELKILLTLTDIDVLVLEYSVAMSSDHRLAYKYRKNSWQNLVFDDEVYDAIRIVMNVWGGEEIPPRDLTAPNFKAVYDEAKNSWTKVSANPDEPLVIHYNRQRYKSGKDRLKNREGLDDLDSEDREVIRTEFVSQTILRRIYEICIENQVGLILYIPTTSREYTELAGLPLLAAELRYARTAVRFFAEEKNIQAFDYYSLNNDNVNFIDPIHMYREPAIEFSKVLFSDLYDFLNSDEKDFEYVVR